MLTFITATENLPFSFALALMLLIFLLELLGMLMGVGLSQLFDGLLPDLDLDVDLDADLDGGDVQVPALSALAGWLRLGQVPVLILLIVFLTCFGLLGYTIQSAAQGLFGAMLPAWPAAAATFLVSLPCFRLFSGVIARIAPKDETSAVSDTTFIGRIATITLGTAAKGSPAEAKLEDQYGQTHYIMVVPDLDEERFNQGERVLLVRKDGSLFAAIASDNQILNDP
jgi:hypothetical protein